MKVYQIEHEDMGKGYCLDDPEYFRPDLEVELDEGEDCSYTINDINGFIQEIKDLEINKCAFLGDWTVTCEEMDKDKFENLDEFVGW